MKEFESINRGFNTIFKPDKISVGLVVPIENYARTALPTLEQHLERVQQIEQLGFAALWLRDIPFHVPSFGDVGQIFDPFTYLGYLAGQIKEIALGVSSIALPLRHPIHVAKSAASIDQLSKGRLILGVASGDRPDEYPAMGLDFEKRGALFQESFSYLRKAQERFPSLATNHYGNLKGKLDVLPKAVGSKIPMLVTGYSQQSLKWNAENSDGWMYYPRDVYIQKNTIRAWRSFIPKEQAFNKPFMQPLYLDLQENADTKPLSIPLGYKTGLNYLIDYLYQLQELGVNHIALNLRFNSMNMNKTLEELAHKVIPLFQENKQQQ